MRTLRMMSDVGVNSRCIGPVGFDRDDREAVLFDQSARDRRPGTIEFRRAMGRFAQKDDGGVGKAVKEGAKIVRLPGWRQGFEIRPECSGQPTRRLDFASLSPGYDAHCVTVYFSREPNPAPLVGLASCDIR